MTASRRYHVGLLFQSIAAYPPGTLGARLGPTLEEASKLRRSASLQGTRRCHDPATRLISLPVCPAKWTVYSINVAIALQVVLGALTTALGASLHGNSVRL